MMGRISTRLDLFQAYFSSSRNFPFSFLNLVRNGVIKLPCTSIGSHFIESIQESEDSEFLGIKIKAISTPLYWPCVLPLFDLYKVVTECFSEADWHFYEVPETQVEPGDTVLDCGAAEGIFSLRVQERAGHIAVFEPLPLFGDSLNRTFASAANVTVISCALGDTQFLRKIRLIPNISAKSGFTKMVKTSGDNT